MNAARGHLAFVTKKGVTVTGTSLTFTRDVSKPFSISTTTPFERNAEAVKKCVFEVMLNVKEQRTAIGFLFDEPCVQYMTPDYMLHARYVSMGGAGFIYPRKERASKGYGEGDRVRCELDFLNNKVGFFVNGGLVGTAHIAEGVQVAYPTVSSEGGVVHTTVSFS